MIGLSYFFYGWVGWSYCLLLLTTTAVAHFGGVAIMATKTDRSRRWAMGISVSALLALLGWFKYYGFVSVNLDNLTHAIGLGRQMPLLQVALPIAISFFTFMAVSYVVDIYRRALEPARPLDLALYLSFFPHLLAGPIVRGNELLPQLRKRRDPDQIDYSRALWLIMTGLFKKVVISSYVASAIVTPVFTDPSQHSAPEAIFSAWGYARADLLRLQRVHRHRHRAGPPLGHPVPHQLRRALHGAQPAGLLAPLAHHAVPMAARLPLHPAGRQQRLRRQDDAQHHDHHGAGRTVARRGVDVRLLGGPARCWARWSGICQRRRRVDARSPARGRRAGAHLGAAVLDLPVRVPGLGVLQRRRGSRRPSPSSAAW